MPNKTVFEDKLKEYLKPWLGYPNYQTMYEGHINIKKWDLMIRDRLEQYMSIKGKNVLVSGCSSGGELITFHEKGAKKVIGTEVNPKLIKLANIRVRNIKEIEVKLYDGEHIPERDNYFDIVNSSHIIEHTKDPEQYLVEHIRVLKKGGILMIEFPNKYFLKELHTRIFFIAWLPKDLINKCSRIIPKFIKNKKRKFYYRSLSSLNFLTGRSIIKILKKYSIIPKKIIIRKVNRHGKVFKHYFTPLT